MGSSPESPGCEPTLLILAWATSLYHKSLSFIFIHLSIQKEVNAAYSLEWLMLKLQYFGHLMWTANSLEKTLMLGRIEGKKRRGWQRVRWLDGITNSMGMSLGRSGDSEGQEAGCAAVLRVATSRSDRTWWQNNCWYLHPWKITSILSRRCKVVV